MAATASSSSLSSSDSDNPRAFKRELEQSDNEDVTASDSSDSDEIDAEPTEEEDVPVLSHAELRRQKKREVKAQKTAAGDSSKTNKPTSAEKSKDKVKNTAELAPSKVPKRQNSVWVGNLSFKTTPDALRRFFDGVGDITRVHMPMKMASAGPGARGAVKENRGFVVFCIIYGINCVFTCSLHAYNRFAYVDFASPDAKTVAITLSENHLDGRRLLIKDGSFSSYAVSSRSYIIYYTKAVTLQDAPRRPALRKIQQQQTVIRT
jgi:RNA recognition motif-containing protein